MPTAATVLSSTANHCSPESGVPANSTQIIASTRILRPSSDDIRLASIERSVVKKPICPTVKQPIHAITHRMNSGRHSSS